METIAVESLLEGKESVSERIERWSFELVEECIGGVVGWICQVGELVWRLIGRLGSQMAVSCGSCKRPVEEAHKDSYAERESR